MYNDYYPDLILEGLLYDLEYVSESSNNKEGILTKLKIAIKKLVQKIISLFRKIKEKIFGKKNKEMEPNDDDEYIITHYKPSTNTETNFTELNSFINNDFKKIYTAFDKY